MTAPTIKNQQGKRPSVSGRSKSGKRKTFEQYQAAQRAALDAFRKAAGG